MVGGEGAVFLGDAGYVGAGVVDPDLLGGVALGEEDDVGLGAGTVGAEGAVGQAQDGVQGAVFGEDLEDLARLVGEQAVVGQYDGGAAAGLEDGHDVLDEVKLLVGGGDCEILAGRRLVGALGAEGRIGHDDVKAAAIGDFVDRVAQGDVGFQAVQVEVHQGQPTRAGDEFLAVIGGGFQAFGEATVDGAAAGLAHKPFVGNHEKAAGAASGIGDGKFGMGAGIGFHAADDGLDQQAGGEILTRAFLTLIGGLLQESLEGGGLDIHIQRGPFRLVDQANQFFQVNWIAEPRLRPGEDVSQEARLLTQFPQDIDVIVGQIRTALGRDLRPVTTFRQFDSPLIRHLDKEQIGNLLDVIPVIDPVMPQRMTESPKFLYNVTHFCSPKRHSFNR